MILSSYYIAYNEIPDKIGLALNIAECPHSCAGCHSPELQTENGVELTKELLLDIIDRHRNLVSVIIFMGGDSRENELVYLASIAKQSFDIALYTGLSQVPPSWEYLFDYIKVGRYIKTLGDLTSPTTNQRLYETSTGKQLLP